MLGPRLPSARTSETNNFESAHIKRAAEVVSHLGQCLTRAREQAGLSQEELAHAAQITTRTYGVIERGWTPKGVRANPTLDSILRIFSALEDALADRDVSLTPCHSCPLASRNQDS